MDIRGLFAAQSYAATQKAAAVAPDGTGVGQGLATAARSFEETLKSTETVAQAAMTGGLDPHVLVHTLAQTELAVEAAVTVRNKVVEAYQEILRMPV